MATPQELRPEGDVSREASEQTPEPSPEGPPAATSYVNGTHHTQQHAYSDDYDALLVATRQMLSFDDGMGAAVASNHVPLPFPKAPSPCSPPPASIFSGAGPNCTSNDPSRIDSQRPPLREVVTGQAAREGAAINTSRVLGQLNEFPVPEPRPNMDMNLQQYSSVLSQSPPVNIPALTASLQQQQQQLQLQQLTQRQHALPAVMQLKKELMRSQQSFILLEQEHKAVVTDFESMKAQIEAERRSWNDQMSETRASLDKLSRENSLLTEETKSLKEKAESLDQAKRQIESAAHEEAASLRQQLESLNSEMQQSSQSLSQLECEKQTLASELNEAREKSDKAVSDQNRLREQVQGLELETSQMRSKLGAATTESSHRVRSLEESHTTKVSSLEREMESRKLEIDQLKAMVKEKDLNMQKESREAVEQTVELESERAQLGNEVSRLEKALKVSNQRNNVLRGENLNLREKVKRKDEWIKEHEKKKDSIAEVSCQTDNIPNKTPDRVDSSTQTIEPPTATSNEDPTAVALWLPAASSATATDLMNDRLDDRLGRIRDATERAALSQNYHRRVKKLMAEHEAEILRLEKDHGESLRRVESEAKVEAEEMRRQLIAEHDAKVTALEKKHLEEIERTLESSDAVAKEAVQAAVSEVTTTQQQLDREVETRKELETTVGKLSQQLKAEQQKASEHDLYRREWEEQTKVLLSSIREDCNVAFVKRTSTLPLPSSSASSLLRMQHVNTATTAAAAAAAITGSTPRSIFTVETDQESPSLLGDGATTRSTASAATLPRSSPTANSAASPTWVAAVAAGSHQQLEFSTSTGSGIPSQWDHDLDGLEDLVQSVLTT